MKAKGPVFLLGRRNLKFWHEAIRGDKELECFAPIAIYYSVVMNADDCIKNRRAVFLVEPIDSLSYSLADRTTTTGICQGCLTAAGTIVTLNVVEDDVLHGVRIAAIHMKR